MKSIAIGVVIVALASTGAAAQTAGEQAQILRDFQASVADYTQRDRCLDVFPGTDTATAGPRIFTLPVAMVFRQMIARTLVERDGVAALNGVGAYPHAVAFAPLPAALLQDFPRALQDTLPPLPTPLEYRLIGHDLVVRDADAGLVVGVLRDAVGPALTVIR
jgi:hypothetical protein